MYVLGRAGGEGPAGALGRYRARDGSDGAPVGIDLSGPHAVAVVGKRGSGKSHTLGVLAEELAEIQGIAPVVADPMGAFGSLAPPVDPRVPTSALDPRAWCELLGLEPTSAAGSLVWRAAETADTLDGMCAFVDDADASRAARRGATNHLRLAESWGVFGSGGFEFDGSVTVLDLAGLDRAPMNAVVRAVAARCYDARVAGELERLPWLLVDEAHAFFDGLAAPALHRLLTRGRGPGASLVVATQRPDALPAVALSQSDLLVAHRLTAGRDRAALERARPALFGDARPPRAPGEAVVYDDATGRAHALTVRERRTAHGGAGPRLPKTPSDPAETGGA